MIVHYFIVDGAIKGATLSAFSQGLITIANIFCSHFSQRLWSKRPICCAGNDLPEHTEQNEIWIRKPSTLISWACVISDCIILYDQQTFSGQSNRRETDGNILNSVIKFSSQAA